FPLPRPARNVVAERPARAGCRARDSRRAVPAEADLARAALAAHGRRGGAGRRGGDTRALLRGARALAADDRGTIRECALRRLRLRPAGLALAPAVRARVEYVLRLLRVRDGEVELGPALVLRRADRRDGARRDGRVPGVPALPVRAVARGPRRRAGTRRAGRAERRAGAAARVGDDRGAGRDDGRER